MRRRSNITIPLPDPDTHAAFRMYRVRVKRIKPAPCIQITNVRRVTHYQNGVAMHDAFPEYPRALVKGDWT